MVWDFHMGIPTALLANCLIAGDMHAVALCALESRKPFTEHSHKLLGVSGALLTHMPLFILLSGPWSMYKYITVPWALQ